MPDIIQKLSSLKTSLFRQQHEDKKISWNTVTFVHCVVERRLWPSYIMSLGILSNLVCIVNITQWLPRLWSISE